MKQSGHLNPSEETRTGCIVTSKYGGRPPNKHGGVGRQQQQGISYRPISLLSVISDTGEEPSSLHNRKHTKHTHTTRVQNTTLCSDGTTHIKQHSSKWIQPNSSPAQTFTVAPNMSEAFVTINIHTLIRRLIQTKTPSTMLLLYALFNHPRLLIQVARVQKAQFSYRLDGLVP